MPLCKLEYLGAIYALQIKFFFSFQNYGLNFEVQHSTLQLHEFVSAVLRGASNGHSASVVVRHLARQPVS